MKTIFMKMKRFTEIDQKNVNYLFIYLGLPSVEPPLFQTNDSFAIKLSVRHTCIQQTPSGRTRILTIQLSQLQCAYQSTNIQRENNGFYAIAGEEKFLVE